MRFATVAVFALALTAFAQQDPWKSSDLIQPAALAARIEGSSAKPVILFVGFPVLYRSAHLPGAILAGPVSKPEGLAALKEAASKLPHNADIVIYCGCCPFDHCPNIRPAYSELRKMGFTKVSVLSVPSNMSKDWIDKGYPVERPNR